MFELYNIWTDELILTGTAQELSDYTGKPIDNIYYHSKVGSRMGSKFLVKHLYRKSKRYDVYEDGVLVGKNMSVKDISKKYYIDRMYVYKLVKAKRKTLDGLEIVEHGKTIEHLCR